jgi:hypothetical protein
METGWVWATLSLDPYRQHILFRPRLSNHVQLQIGLPLQLRPGQVILPHRLLPTWFLQAWVFFWMLSAAMLRCRPVKDC